MEIRFDQIHQQDYAEAMLDLFRRLETIRSEFVSICSSLDSGILSVDNVSRLIASTSEHLSDTAFEIKRHWEFLTFTIDEYIEVEKRSNRLAEDMLPRDTLGKPQYLDSGELSDTARQTYGYHNRKIIIPAITDSSLSKASTLSFVARKFKELPSSRDESESLIFRERLPKRSHNTYIAALDQSIPALQANEGEVIVFIRAVAERLNLRGILTNAIRMDEAVLLLRESGAENGWFPISHADAVLMADDGYPVITVYDGNIAFYCPKVGGVFAAGMKNNIDDLMIQQSEFYVHA